MNKEIYIVAGGTSLKDFDFDKLKGKDVIAVNKSIIDCPWAKYFITMDYTFIDHIVEKTKNKLTLKAFKNTPSEKYFIVAINNKYIQKRGKGYVDTRYNYCYYLKNFDHIIEARNEHDIGTSFETFGHGCNSGTCALQLALLLNYEKIYLLGVDLYIGNETHYHGGYSESINKFQKKLDFYIPYFINNILMSFELFPNTSIYSCSKDSTLNDYIPYISLENIK